MNKLEKKTNYENEANYKCSYVVFRDIGFNIEENTTKGLKNQ